MPAGLVFSHLRKTLSIRNSAISLLFWTSTEIAQASDEPIAASSRGNAEGRVTYHESKHEPRSGSYSRRSLAELSRPVDGKAGQLHVQDRKWRAAADLSQRQAHDGDYKRTRGRR